MGAFKKFNSQDVYVSTYTAHKSFIASGSQYSNSGILNIPGYSGSTPYFPSDDDILKNYNARLSYESIKHLYYSSFENGSITTGSAYENYLQSSFNISSSRTLSNEISIYSLSKNAIGTAIKPNSLLISPETGSEEYFVSNTVIKDLIEVVGTLYSTLSSIDLDATPNQGVLLPPILPGTTERIVDDGEGNLFLESAVRKRENKRILVKKIGNVIYPQGQVIITDDIIAQYYNHYIDAEIQWKSTQPIYTYNFHCKMKENEFTHTFNPSAVTGSNGQIRENVAGEEFSPYFSTIGLYNDANELIAVAKPGQPIPISKDTDMTVVVKLDI